MKKIISIIILTIFLFSGETNKWQQTKSQGVSLKWICNETNLTITISAPTTGWVSVGFNPENKMLNANILMGYVKNGKLFTTDHYGIHKVKHQDDSKIGGTNNIITATGDEKNGITSITFTIPLDSGDKFDSILIPGKDTVIIFAYGRSDNFSSIHKKRGKVTVKL